MANPFNQKGATWNYGEHAARRAESEKKHKKKETIAEQQKRHWLDLQKHENTLPGEGRGGYSYKDIHKTPLSKLVGATHGHKHDYEWEDNDAQCKICGKDIKTDKKAMGEAEARADAAYEAWKEQHEEGEGRGDGGTAKGYYEGEGKKRKFYSKVLDPNDPIGEKKSGTRKAGDYWKVIGKDRDDRYQLGYTGSKAAWLRNSNGWKKKDLEFIKMHRENKGE